MVHTIDLLKARIEFLEFHIQSLLSYNKKKRISGFHVFAQSVRPHVRSYLFHIYHFNPTNTDIIKEISAMWNDISTEEKDHWILHASS